MTLNSTTTKISYNGDGATVEFDVPFKFLQNSHIVAVLRDKDGVEATWTEGGQYSLIGAGAENGGTLTANAPPAGGETLVIKRAVPETQGTALPLGGKFSSTTVEQMVDLLTMQVQAHSEEIARTLSVSAADPIASVVLPSVQNRSSKILAFDAAGEIATVTNFGKWRGTWAASTAYVLGDVVQRDATKDLYIAVGTGFTSGSDEATDISDTTRWALAMQQPTVNFFSDSFTGTGAQSVFTLSNAPVSAAATAVYLNGVRQEPVTDYTVVGTTLTFAASPGNGVEILAVYGNAGAADVADAAITTAKLANDAVTADKIAPGAARVFGEIIDYGGATAPAGWAVCDGGELNRTTHNDLFTAIGTTFGSGNGTTTYNVPDLRGRVTAGVDGAAGRLTNQPGSVNGDAVGNVGGAETHTLTVQELASHTHTTRNIFASGTNTTASPGSTQGAVNVEASGAAGGDQPHNNVQPTMILNKIIYHGVI